MLYLFVTVLALAGIGCTESRPSSERRADQQKQVVEENRGPASEPGPSMGSQGNPATGNTGEAAGGSTIGRDHSTKETMPVNETGRTKAAGSDTKGQEPQQR